MLGQGIEPEHYHQLTQAMSDQDLSQFLTGIKTTISRAVERMPRHQDFLDQYCKAGSEVWERPRAPAPQSA